MEKDIGKIRKNENTEIVVRVDDFGGKVGVTVREFTSSERYTGFTKAGTRIPAEKFKEFKELINSIDENDLKNNNSTDSTEENKNNNASEEDSEEEIEDY